MAPAPDQEPAVENDDDLASRGNLEPRAAGDTTEQGEIVDGEFAPDERRVSIGRAFSGPLPPPDVLGHYDEVIPGLGREIVEQWKLETAHRHKTVDQLRRTDHEAMRRFYAAERLGQVFALIAFTLMLVVATVAIDRGYPGVSVASLAIGGAAIIWAMRRRSTGAHGSGSEGDNAVDLGDGDSIEGPKNDKAPSPPSGSDGAQGAQHR